MRNSLFRPRSGPTSFGEPTGAAITFSPVAFNGTRDQAAGTYLFTASIGNPAAYSSFTFTNWRRTAGSFTKLQRRGSGDGLSCEFESTAMTGGDVAAHTVVISVDFSSAGISGTISNTIPGQIDAPPGTHVVSTVEVVNFGAVASPVFGIMPLAVADGDVPASSTIQLRRQDTGESCYAALLQPNSRPDNGMMRRAAIAYIDDTGDLAAGASRIYEVVEVTGGRVPSASGFDMPSWIAANSDYSIECQSMQQDTGTLNWTDMSPAQRDIVANDHIAVSTRREYLLDSSRVQVMRTWGMAGDDGHVKAYHYHYLFRQAGGTVLGCEYKAKITLDWWVNDPLSKSESKYARRFVPVIKNGVSTVDTIPGTQTGGRIRLNYGTGIPVVVRSGDMVARGWWIAGSESRQPTLRYKVNAPAWVQTPAVPRYDLTYIPQAKVNSLSEGPVLPGDEYNFLAFLPSQGGSNNRGLWTVPDLCHLLVQSFKTDKVIRVQGLASMGIGEGTVRSHLIGPNGDILSKLVPFKIQTPGATRFAWTTTADMAQLGPRRNYNVVVSGTTQGIDSGWDHVNPSPLTLSASSGKYQTGNADWSGSDPSHGVAFAVGTYILTGDPYYLDIALDCIWCHVLGSFGSNGSTLNISQRIRDNSGHMAAGKWLATYVSPFIGDKFQVRGFGWLWSAIANGMFIAPDGSDEKTLLEETAAANATYWAAQIDKWEDNDDLQFQRLFPLLGGDWNEVQSWMWAFVGMGCIRAAEALPANDEMQKVAEYMSARWIKQAGSDYPMLISNWQAPSFVHNEPWNGTTNDWFPIDGMYQLMKRNASDATIIEFTAAKSTSSNDSYKNSWKPTVGDVFYAQNFRGTIASPVLPAGLTAGQPFYVIEVVDVTNGRIRFSATEGGSAITMTTVGGQFRVWCAEPAYLLNHMHPRDPAKQTSPSDNMDEYWHIGMAVSIMAAIRPNRYCTSGEISAAVDNIRTMYDNYKAHRDERLLNYNGAMPSWQQARP